MELDVVRPPREIGQHVVAEQRAEDELVVAGPAGEVVVATAAFDPVATAVPPVV